MTAFLHLFAVSLLPFSTGWIANSRLAALPVAIYASVFVLVNITYLVLCAETLDRFPVEDASPKMRRMMRVRSVVTLGIFSTAALVALKSPLAAFGLICGCLILYTQPEVPGSSGRSSAALTHRRPVG